MISDMASRQHFSLADGIDPSVFLVMIMPPPRSHTEGIDPPPVRPNGAAVAQEGGEFLPIRMRDR